MKCTILFAKHSSGLPGGAACERCLLLANIYRVQCANPVHIARNPGAPESRQIFYFESFVVDHQHYQTERTCQQRLLFDSRAQKTTLDDGRPDA
jgi:hypothetical protein